MTSMFSAKVFKEKLLGCSEVLKLECKWNEEQILLDIGIPSNHVLWVWNGRYVARCVGLAGPCGPCTEIHCDLGEN